MIRNVQDILSILDKLHHSPDVYYRAMSHWAREDVQGGREASLRETVAAMVDRATTGKGATEQDTAMVDELSLLVYDAQEPSAGTWGEVRRAYWRANVGECELTALYTILCELEAQENILQGGGKCLS